MLRDIRARFDGSLALNAWAGRPGQVAIGDTVERLDERLELAVPAGGRFIAA